MALFYVFLLSFLPSKAQAQNVISKAINPFKMVVPMVRPYQHGRIKNDQTSLTQLHYDSFRNKVVELRGSYKVNTSTLKQFKKVSSTTYTTLAGFRNAYGSAVHIGGPYVLTSQHVISNRTLRDKNDKERFYDYKCRRFKIRSDNTRGLRRDSKCKKVIYCHAAIDFCLVEMDKKLSDKTPAIIDFESRLEDNEQVYTAVGNPMGYGHYLSKGKGIKKAFGYHYEFYAPILGGFSGGGLYNDKGQLVGLIKAENRKTNTKEAANYAIPIWVIFSMLKRSIPGGHPLWKIYDSSLNQDDLKIFKTLLPGDFKSLHYSLP